MLRRPGGPPATPVGVSAAVDVEDTQTNSYLDGAASATGDISVTANMSQGNGIPTKELFVIPTLSSGVSSQAGVGSASKGNVLDDAQSKLISGAGTAVQSLLSKIQGKITEDAPADGPSEPADLNNTFDVGAALSVAVDLDSANARIGDGSTSKEVSTTGNVYVMSNVSYAPSVSASSSVSNNPEPVEGKSTTDSAASIGISFGYVANNAQAYINKDAQVDALGNIAVQSQALNNYTAFYKAIEGTIDEQATYTASSGAGAQTVAVIPGQTVQLASGYTGGGDPGYWYTYTPPQGTTPPPTQNINTIDYATNSNWTATPPAEQKTMDTLAQLSNYIMGDWGVGEVLFTTMSQATAEGKTIGAAGAVTFLDVQNTSDATIVSGAKINQNLNTLYPVVGATPPPGSVIVQALSSNQSVNFIGNINIPGCVDITSGSGKELKDTFFGGAGTKGKDAVGASLLFSLYGDNTEAVIQSGATVYADSLFVDAEAAELGVGIGASGGKADSVGVLGTVSVNYVNDTTLAQIQSGSTITVLGGSVQGACTAVNMDLDPNSTQPLPISSPSQDGSVVVNADDTAYIITVDGGVVVSEGTGVGASAGLNIFDRTTQAVIGDIPVGGVTQAAPTGSFSSGGNTLVNSDNNGYAVVLAVTGSEANPKPAADSGKSLSKNPGTGGTQGSDGSSSSNADLEGWQSKQNAVLNQMVTTTPVKGNVASLSSDAGSSGKSTNSSKAGIAISGSAGVNVLLDTADAWITNVPTVDVTGSLSLSAENNTNVITIAGAVAIAKGSGESTAAAVSGAFALNVLEGSTDASIIGADSTNDDDIDITGALNIDATGGRFHWRRASPPRRVQTATGWEARWG